MAKKRIGKPRREATRRQLSHWQKQKRRQRIIRGVGIFIVATVLGIMGAGWYVSTYQPLHQVVVEVNSTEFNMDYYIKMLEFYGSGQPVSFLPAVANDIVVVIQRNELVRKGALKLGIVVTAQEVKEELENHDPPFNDAHRDIVRTQLVTRKLLDKHFEQTVPRLAEQRHIMAMFLEGENQADEIRARIVAGEDFAELAAELSLDGFSKDNQGDLGWHPEDILVELLASSIPVDSAFDSGTGVLSQPLYDEEKAKSLGYWLVKIADSRQEPEQVQVQAMLLGSEQEAQEVSARLEAGEDFAELARELSRHEATKSSGGDFDWLSSGDVLPGANFAAWADIFELETGELSQPIPDDMQVTAGGYWLLRVLDKEDSKQISDDDRDLLKSKALNDWVFALWDDPANEVDVYLTEQMMEWAIARVTKSLN